MLDFSDKNALKTFAEQLTQTIKANENGEIFIDSSRINPQCLHLLYKPPLPQSQNLIKSDPVKNLKKFDRKKLLCKGMKFKGSRKYFLVANYIERPIQSQAKKLFQSNSEVFEDYESLVEVVATTVANDSVKIQWEMAELDAFIFTNTTNAKEAVKALIEGVQIIGLKGEKFLFALNEESYKRFSQNFLKEEFKNVVFIQEKVLRILQNKVKSRKFLLNYKRYCKELSKKNVIVKGLFKIGNEKALIYLIEDKPVFEIAIWELKMFQKSSIELDWDLYGKVLKKGDRRMKKSVLSIIQKHLTIYNQNLQLDEKACLVNIKKLESLENVQN